MKVENDTNEPVDYEQDGSGSDDDENGATGNSGRLNANGQNGSTATFTPSGPPPWTVKFTNASTGAPICSVGNISNASADVVLNADGSCSKG